MENVNNYVRNAVNNIRKTGLAGGIMENTKINDIICRVEDLAHNQPGLAEILEKIADEVQNVQSAVSSERILDISLDYKDYGNSTKTSYSRRLKSGDGNGENYND